MDESSVKGKFPRDLWEKIQELNTNESQICLPLIIRLASESEELTNKRIEDVKNYTTYLLTGCHNSTVYFVCHILPFVMAKVPVGEAEKIARYDFVESLDDGDRRGHFELNVSRAAIKADYVKSGLGFDGQGIRIAVLDAACVGIGHPDFDDLDDDPSTNDPKIVYRANFFDVNDDGVTDEEDWDMYGHATAVAGIACGTGQASNHSFIGVAPGAWLMTIKVGGTISGSVGFEEDDVIIGIEDAISHGADIINLSLGGPGGDGKSALSRAVDDAIEEGVVVVAAVGNEGPTDRTCFPADAFNVIAVGAINDKNTPQISDDIFWDKSNPGPTQDGRPKPDVVAPGVHIISCRAWGTDLRWFEQGDTYISDYYVECTGTSGATPHVAGTVALMLQANPDLTPAQTKAILRQKASLNANLSGYDVNDRGYGIIDAQAAVQLAQNVNDIQNSQMFDSWNCQTPVYNPSFGNYEQITFTIDPPSAPGIRLSSVVFHWWNIWGQSGSADILKKIYARDAWINGQYYDLGVGMNQYLFSGPRVDGFFAYVQIKARYRVGNMMINYTWIMLGVDYIALHIDYGGGSSWKTLIYADVDNEDSTNFAYLPQMPSEKTVLTERCATQMDMPIDIRDLGHEQYWQLYNASVYTERWILREGYFGNDPASSSASNGEYVYNRDFAIHVQQYTQSAYIELIRKQGQVTADTTQNDALSGHDAGNNFTDATGVLSYTFYDPYEGILCASDPEDNHDYYKFIVANGQYIYARLISPENLDFNTELFNPSGGLVDSSSNGAGQIDSVFSIANAAGYWRLHISRASGEGKYLLFIYTTAGAHGMKTTTNGYFYKPALSTQHFKINLIFDNMNVTGDQAPSQMSGYNFPFPDGNVDIYDISLVSGRYGLSEGESGWVYMADVTPDKMIDIFDISPIAANYGKSGSYTSSLSGITVDYTSPGGNGTLTPDQKGFVQIPVYTTSITIKRNGNPVGAMIIFYTN